MVWISIPKCPYVEMLVPILALQGSCGIFKMWGLGGDLLVIEGMPLKRTWGTSPFLFLSFCFLVTTDEQFPPLPTSNHNVLPHHRPKRNGTNGLWTETSETGNKINLSSH
jgi:hypothetical protein